MKRISAILLAALLAMTMLYGCGSETAETTTQETTSSGVISAADASSSEEAEDDTDEEEETSEVSFGPEDYSYGYTDDGYLEGITASDYIELPDFSTFEYEYSDLAPSDDTVYTAIYYFLMQYFLYEDYDSEIEDGDSVNIDYVGTVDGEEFEGGSTDGEGTDVTIGVTSYIDGFLDQLIGHKPGETFDINVTFPDDYDEESLQGKDAVFTTTVNYISKTPEFTDELISENQETFDSYFGEGCETTTDVAQVVFDSYYQENLSDAVDDDVQEYMDSFDAPQEAIDIAVNQMNISVESYYGMSLDEFAETYGYSDSEMATMEENEAKYLILYQAIAEANDWHYTEDDMREIFGDSFDTYLETYGLGYIAEYMIYENAITYMTSSVTINGSDTASTTTAAE